MSEAAGLGHRYVGTEHLLLGLLREGDGVAARILDEEMRPAPELGQEIDAFQSQLLALPEFKTLWAMER
ncbi:Clp protease N-terminal domain-containing protein, partial [Intestinimonas massiliensis (ex Afouda et al. 2020)]|uniref:Clp protease N-terminal domain-containing protein n=1 Tax=Intestinimonas massiliensis (ex Afouda et al. 2020) TaxID=1673721 RepID=UPI00266CFD57